MDPEDRETLCDLLTDLLYARDAIVRLDRMGLGQHNEERLELVIAQNKVRARILSFIDGLVSREKGERDMRIFAMALSARIGDTGGYVTQALTTPSASSEEEAIGIGIKVARDVWPTPDYSAHQCSVVEIPQEWLEEANDG